MLLSHDELYVEANRAALLEVYGLDAEGPDQPGNTALRHTRRALEGAGLSTEEIDPRLPDWCESMAQHYEVLLADADTSGWLVATGVKDVLAALPRRAVLTGNPERVARARLERIGLGGLFEPGRGAFGCEREDRVELFELARGREADRPPAAAIVTVGDTPLDVSSAHEAGARCVAVTTGAFGPSELREADAVIADLRELPSALRGLAR